MSKLTDLLPPLDRSLAELLQEYGVSAEALDGYTNRFRAVPVSGHFSKPRTNLILRRLTQTGSSTVYLDHDLAYHGPDQGLAAALAGPCRDAWRRLQLPPVPGDVNEVLCKVLDLLGSPLAGRARAVLDRPPHPPLSAVVEGEGRGPHAQRPELGRMLAAAGRRVDSDAAAAAYESSFRKETAHRLAVLLTHPAAPSSAVLTGKAGSGRRHLLRACAHLLLEAGVVTRAFSVAAARVAAGCTIPGEFDLALLRLLDDALDQPASLLLIHDLDVCLTGTPVCAALLCDALDRGLRLLATFRSETAGEWLKHDEALGRRLALVPISTPGPADVAGALQRLADRSAVTVSPVAIQTTLRLARKRDAAEPAGSLGLLGAALAEAVWQGSDQIGPDDIFAAQLSIWPVPDKRGQDP